MSDLRRKRDDALQQAEKLLNPRWDTCRADRKAYADQARQLIELANVYTKMLEAGDA